MRQEQVDEMRLGFTQQIAVREERIRHLERQVESLQAALPRAEIVHDLSSASVEDLEGLQVALRHVAEKRLLTVRSFWTERYEHMTGMEKAGLARILPRGRYETLITARGGGAYYSFATKSHSYDKEPDLELQQGRYMSGFAGQNDGWFLDLGDVPIEEIEADAARPPAGLAGESLEIWNFLWTERPTIPLADPRDRFRDDTFLREMSSRAHALKLSRVGVDAISGHTYILRAILPGEHDHLVAFRDLEDDGSGRTLAWRVLKSWELPWHR